MIRTLGVVGFLLVGWLGSASALTLTVGADQQYKQPSQAIAAAHDGDTIRIEPGTYFDCAIVRPSHLVIEGIGQNVVMTDRPCGGKALLIINGNDTTIRNLTLQRVRVPDHNGAGIRAQGGNLTVENTRFINDEDGILTVNNPRATIKIIGSQFIDNGGCFSNGFCAHAIYINHVGDVQVENSRFYDNHGGHSIKSRAFKTEVLNCAIEDGPEGTSSYLIDIPNGGTTTIVGNRLEKGPKAQNWATAITIGEEGVKQPTDSIIVKNNVLTNDTGHPTTFVRNLTATPAQLSGNVFKGGKVVPLQGDGSTG